MTQWRIIAFFFLIKYSFVNCEQYQCNYIVNKSDHSSGRCVNDQCYQFLDLFSIMVEPKTCKTSLLSLSFSSYQNFTLFRDRIQWKLGDLFVPRSIEESRQLILFLNHLDYNDKPFDNEQLIRLGINIDFYTIYIRQIQNKNYLSGLIHYDPNNPEWNIIKLKFRCLKLSAFDKYPCSSKIISPSVFAPQRSFQSTIKTSLSTEKSIIKSNEENKKFTHLILIILLPLIIIFISISIFILFYKYFLGNSCFNEDTTTQKSPSLTNTSDHLNTTQRISSSSLFDSPAVPMNTFNGDQMQNPIEYDNRHLHTKAHFTNNLNDNYEKVTLDGISLTGQQHFVRISSSIHL